MADRPIRLSLLGRDAAACLDALAEDGGTVLAVFRRSAYLDHGEALVCIGPATLGAGPLNALAGAGERMPDWRAAGLAPGDPVAPSGGFIRIGGLASLAFRDARLHAPPRGPCFRGRESLAAALALLGETLDGFALDEGLAPFVHPVSRASPPGDALIRRARPAISALESWIAAGAAHPPPADAVERLVGLGPGLTPSGDDFLGGVAIALAMSGEAGAAAALAAPMLAVARRATNRISAAHLDAAARGLGADALHRAIDALARLRNDALVRALGDLDAIGHSSGWDALAGAVAALAGLERRAAPQPASRAAAVSAAPALDSATTTPASRSAST